MNYFLDTLAGFIAMALAIAVPCYALYVVLGVIERRQRRNKRVRSYPPKAFRDYHTNVSVRGNAR